jgi:2-dehydropantoate 2-reductase
MPQAGESSMRIAIYGTGGVGGYFGARLAAAGEDVVFVARGEHLAAIRAAGLKLESVMGDVLIHPAQASDSPADIGPVDVILLCVKTWQVTDAANALRPMLGPDTFVVPLQNGVETPELLSNLLGTPRVVGGLCGILSFVAGPGHIRHVGGATFIKFGELDNHPSERVERLRAAFVNAGVKVEVPADIHTALWEKFTFIVPVGGVGAMAGVPIGATRSDPETRALLERCIGEVVDVGRARGVSLGPDLVSRTMAAIDGILPDGTSSLQRDMSAGRRSELDSWVGAVVRLGREAGVPTPAHELIYTALLARELRSEH